MSYILIKLINFYQKYLSFDRGLLMFITPSGACKYQISCSQYTKQMILEYGATRGIAFGLKRILTCR